MKNVFLAMVTASSFVFCESGQPIQLKEHEKWWTNNLGIQIDRFNGWLGDENAISRVCARKHIKEKGYRNVLDIPCGMCTEYFGYKQDNLAIDYLGMDITEQLVTRARNLGIQVVRGSIEKIPCADSSIDICYSRHILEHLSGYEKALSELIRVAKKEVLVVFFMVPHEKETDISPRNIDGNIVFHNYYNRTNLENYVKQNPKVKSVAWESVSDLECILHIYLYEESKASDRLVD